MNQPFVITIDKGVFLPETNNNAKLYAQNRDSLIAMAVGDSFFIDGGTRNDVAGLIRYAKRHLVHLQAIEVESDEVYATAGVRVGRVEQEDLPGRKPTTIAPPEDNRTYWINRKTSKLYICESGVRPADTKAVQISRAEFDLNTGKPVHEVITRYYHHPDSCTVFETNDPEYIPLDSEDEIEQGQYATLRTEYELAGKPSYWKDDKGIVVTEYLPGRHPKPELGLQHATFEEYQRYVNTQLPFTYWKKVNGDIVKVPLAKLQNAYKTPGAVQVTVNEYNDWLATPNEEDL